MVAAEGTGHIRFLLIRKAVQIIQINKPVLHRCFLILRLRGQRSAYGSHKSRVRRTGNLLADVLLQRPENRIVFKCSTLYYDLIPKGIHIRQTHNLGKYILNDRAAKSRYNVFRKSSVSLLRNNAAVHKHCTAAAQDCRMPRRERRLRNLLHRNMQGGCEIFQK